MKGTYQVPPPVKTKHKQNCTRARKEHVEHWGPDSEPEGGRRGRGHPEDSFRPPQLTVQVRASGGLQVSMGFLKREVLGAARKTTPRAPTRRGCTVRVHRELHVGAGAAGRPPRPRAEPRRRALPTHGHPQNLFPGGECNNGPGDSPPRPDAHPRPQERRPGAGSQEAGRSGAGRRARAGAGPEPVPGAPRPAGAQGRARHLGAKFAARRPAPGPG